jgi:hypothetical protein
MIINTEGFMFKRVIFFLVFAVTTNAYDINHLELEQVMTPAEQKLTGIKHLTPTQKEALEKWLTNWSLKLLSTGTRAMSVSNEDPAAAIPEYDIVDNIISGGSQVLLKGGSLWQIFPVDVATAGSWLGGDKIRIQKIGGHNYPYKLNNISSGSYVKATPGEDSSNDNNNNNNNNNNNTEQKEPDLQKSFTLDGIEDDGGLIILNDGSMWEIAPSTRYKTRSWASGDTISVYESGELFFKYKINNKTQFDEVLAKASY